MTSWSLTSFYLFTPLSDPEAVKSEMIQTWQAQGVRALIILSTEGVNGSIAAPTSDLREKFKMWLTQRFGPGFDFKESEFQGKAPFRKFAVKLRPEIVTLNRPDLKPAGPRRHLNSTGWEQAIASGAILLDTRNLYESRIGTFKGAILPPINTFEEFPDAVPALNLPKDQQILIFCTGGIRCEKAIMALEEQGYHNVAQLEGGILRYLEETPGDRWDGECFVFDHRVAVRKDLSATDRYGFCPQCGDPADQRIECAHCGKEMRLCEVHSSEEHPICSKNCRHHRELKKARGTFQPRSATRAPHSVAP